MSTVLIVHWVLFRIIIIIIITSILISIPVFELLVRCCNLLTNFHFVVFQFIFFFFLCCCYCWSHHCYYIHNFMRLMYYKCSIVWCITSYIQGFLSYSVDLSVSRTKNLMLLKFGTHNTFFWMNYSFHAKMLPM